MMCIVIIAQGKFYEFFMHAKDKHTWTNILKQHDEASLETINNTNDEAELELDSSFVSLDEEEIINLSTPARTPTNRTLNPINRISIKIIIIIIIIYCGFRNITTSV